MSGAKKSSNNSPDSQKPDQNGDTLPSEVFLKEHLFADLFERDVLSYVDRELTTISVLTSIGGVEPMLQSHLGICLHVGLTEPQLKHAFLLIQTSVGKTEAEAGRKILT